MASESTFLQRLMRAFANLFSLSLVAMGGFLLFEEMTTPMAWHVEKPKRTPAFKADTLEPLKALWPGQGKKIDIGLNGITFRWLAPKGMASRVVDGKHWLEVFPEGAKEPVLHQEVGGDYGQASWREIKQGKWMWRVVSQYGSNRVVSSMEKFEVEKHRQAKLYLDYPGEDAVMKFRPEIKFTWSIEADVTAYSFQLWSADGKVVQEQKTTVPLFSWPKATAGDYQWRVVALDSLKRSIGESPWRNLSLIQDPIELMAPASGGVLSNDGKSSVHFAWKGEVLDDNAPNFYRLDIGKQAEFTTFVGSMKLKSNRFFLDEEKLEQGRYYWRVALVGPNDSVIKKSGTRHFDLSLPARLSGPKAMQPEGNASFPSKKPVELGWETVTGAKSFQVVVKSDGKEVFKTSTPKPGARVKLKPGNYVWEVSPIDRWNRAGDPTTRNLIITN